MLLDTRLNELTRTIIGCAMDVHGELGCGFPEIIYQRSLAVELSAKGVAYQGGVRLPVF